MNVLQEVKPTTLLLSPYSFYLIASPYARKNTFTREPSNKKLKTNLTISYFLDPALSNQDVATSFHTINISCLITATDISQIKQAFTEYCLKRTWGSIVWMPPTSVCEFGGCFRLRRVFIKNDETDFSEVIQHTQHCKNTE